MRGFQFLTQLGSLLNEVLFAGLVALHRGLQLVLGFLHPTDLCRLLLQLPAKVRECLVTLGDLGTGNFALVGGIAELLFQRSRVLSCNLSLSRLGRAVWTWPHPCRAARQPNRRRDTG